jgi:hypothetical protein
MLQYSFRWKQLSVIAGISYWRFYFRLFPGAIGKPEVLEFLKALQATIGRKLRIIWERLQAYRLTRVRQHVGAQHGALWQQAGSFCDRQLLTQYSIAAHGVDPPR